MPPTGHSFNVNRLDRIGYIILGIILFLSITGLWALLWVPPAMGF